MNPLRLPVFAAALCAAGCASTSKEVDLARNAAICADVPFATRAPGDRAAFVAPLVDARRQDLPRNDGGLPIAYAPDEAWDRAVVEMVGEVLQRELAQSGLFARVQTAATADAVVIQPRLLAFSMGTIEELHGARSFAEVGLELTVLGPAGADGERPVWLTRAFGDRQLSVPAIQPANMFLLAGSSVSKSVAKAMTGLDGTNVGRSGLPLQLGGAAEASAPAR